MKTFPTNITTNVEHSHQYVSNVNKASFSLGKLQSQHAHGSKAALEALKLKHANNNK